MKLSEAIEVLKKLHNWIDYAAGELEPTANTVMEAIDTVVKELEKPTYTPADMEAFWRWTDANGWYYGELEEMWYNDDEELEALKIEDVLKLWEEQK